VAGVFVEENNLAVHISQVRKALAEVDPNESFIETIPRRGYRFLPPVTSGNGTLAAASEILVAPPVERRTQRGRGYSRRRSAFCRSWRLQPLSGSTQTGEPPPDQRRSPAVSILERAGT